ncbi:MAG: hypothetical protein ACXW3O_06575 [Brevundimonas sp.]
MNGWPKPWIWRAVGASLCWLALFVAWSGGVAWLHGEVKPEVPDWLIERRRRQGLSFLDSVFLGFYVVGLMMGGVLSALGLFRLWRVSWDSLSFVSGTTPDYPRIRRRRRTVSPDDQFLSDD